MEELNETILESITEEINKYNAIGKENETSSMNNQLKAYDIMIPALGFVIILTNLIVVLSSGLILKRGLQPKCTYLLLGNVAMADLITGIAVIMGKFLPKADRTHFVCTVQIGMIVSTTVASIYSVGLIAIDRYLYIVHGMRYSQWVYPTRARILICFTWVLGLAIGFAPSMGWSGDSNNGAICWFTHVYPPTLIIITAVLGMIPVGVVIYLYSIILIKALKKVMQLKKSDKGNSEVEPKLRIFRGNQNANKTADPNNTNTGGVQNGIETGNKDPKTKVNKPNKWKAIKVVLLTTGSFVCTWVPYFIASTIFVFCEPKDSMKCQKVKYAIASPLAILGFVNSLLNPLIYAWWHNGFRTTVRKFFFRTRKSNIITTNANTARTMRLTQVSYSSSGSSSGGRQTSISDVPNE